MLMLRVATSADALCFLL